MSYKDSKLPNEINKKTDEKMKVSVVGRGYKGIQNIYKDLELDNEIPFEEKRINLAVNMTRTESDMALRNACKTFIESDVISERDIAMLELFTQIVKEKFEMFDLKVYKDRYLKEIEK